MACTVTIDDATLIATTNSAGDVVRIEVEGDVVLCAELNVSIRDNSAGIDIGTITVTPAANGHWTATFVHGQGFDLKGIVCGDKIEIVAACTKPDDCEDKRERELPCKPGDGGCPNVTGTASVGNCDANGNRPVDLALAFNPPIPQGAFAQVFWSFGGPNAQGQTTAIDTLSTTNGPVAQHHRTTLMPPRPPSGSPNACSYFTSAAITVVVNGQSCPLAPVELCLIVDSCLPCPGDPARNRPPATLTITTPNAWCAPPQAGQAATFAAVANFPAGTPGPPVPSAFDWAVTTPGGANFLRQTNVGSTTTASGWQLNGTGALIAVDLSQPGNYTVSVAVKFPPGAGLPTAPDGTPTCNVTAGGSFRLDPCSGPATCPSITAINVTPSCADPAAGVAANVSFAVATTDPSGLINGFAWDFGEPASGGANQAVTATPNATHSYSGPGNFTVTVRANIRAACAGGGPTTASTLVSVPLCPCPPGQTRDATGRCVAPPPPVTEDFGCMALRELAAALAALAILATMVAFCLFVPPSLPFWIVIGVAAGLALAAAIILAIWLGLPCPRPCAWGLLMAGQIFFGFGWGAVYFFFCCAWLGWVGIVALAIGAGLLAAWINECRPTVCTVFRELAWVLTVVVAPVLAFIILYPPAAACAFGTLLARIITAALTIAAAAIATVALACGGSE